jgi:hypothetical protein
MTFDTPQLAADVVDLSATVRGSDMREKIKGLPIGRFKRQTT